jgi:hypothetical protein
LKRSPEIQLHLTTHRRYDGWASPSRNSGDALRACGFPHNIMADKISFAIPLETDHRGMLSCFDDLFAIARSD